ncbi:MAG: S9 family peptidase [Gemmataceae bacterium]
MPHLFPIDRYLNVRAAASPSFSLDGQFIAYLSNTTGLPQAWLIPTFGGEPVQLTFGADAVRGVHFSPVRHELIFSMDRGGDEHTQLYRLYGIGDTGSGIGDGWDFENLTDHPKAIHAFGGWSHDGTRIAFSANRDDPSRFDIYVMDLASRERERPEEPRLLAKGPGGYFMALEWSPDDRFILAERTESNVNQDLYIIDVATGRTHHLTPHQGDVQYQSAHWWPDGKAVVCVSTYGGRDLAQFATINLATGRIDFGKSYPHEIEHITVSRQGKWLTVHANMDGASHVMLSGQSHVIALPNPVGVVSGAEFSPDENVLALVFDGPRHNSDVWTIDLFDPTSAPVQLTHSGRAGLPFGEFIEPQLIRYKSFDGREIPAWWYCPAKPASGVPPVIVYPHGGPESQTRPNFTSLFQYFLARGYAVLAPNVRGSSGYGTEFMNLDNIEKRMDSVADLAHAAYWLRDTQKGDPRRIAVYGGSYGGFMVLAAVTHYPDLWAAAIDVVGICNFVTFLEKTGDWRRSHREKEYGNLREHREFLERISPIHHVDKIRCPLMVIHGANDPRVPVGEAEQIVAALRARNVPVEYLRYEDEGHGLVKLKNRLDAYPKMAEFLDRYLRT